MSPRSKTRRTFVTSSRTRVRRHGVQAAGPVAAASAFARRYSAPSRSGVAIVAATLRIRSSSVRSRRVAVSGSSRWCATMNEASSRVASGRPIDASVSSAIRVPIGDVAALPGLPDVVQQGAQQEGVGVRRLLRPRHARTGSSGSGAASIDDMPESAAVRCVSTVNRWYGSRCGRHRTAAHAGRNRASSPSRSSVSSARTPGSPARSSRRNASRTSAVPRRPGRARSTASIRSRSSGETTAPAPAVRRGRRGRHPVPGSALLAHPRRPCRLPPGARRRRPGSSGPVARARTPRASGRPRRSAAARR